jgi:MoaD family protein
MAWADNPVHFLYADDFIKFDLTGKIYLPRETVNSLIMRIGGAGMEDMTMKVNFYATLRPIVGQKTVQLSLPTGTTAIQLVRMFVSDYPAMRKELLDTNENFLPHMKFFINGREAVYLPDKFDTVIQPEDKVDIFPPVGGG